MMVIVMIFVVTSVVLVSKNVNLVQTLEQSEATLSEAEQVRLEYEQIVKQNQVRIAFLRDQLNLAETANEQWADERQLLQQQAIDAKAQLDILSESEAMLRAALDRASLSITERDALLKNLELQNEKNSQALLASEQKFTDTEADLTAQIDELNQSLEQQIRTAEVALAKQQADLKAELETQRQLAEAALAQQKSETEAALLAQQTEAKGELAEQKRVFQAELDQLVANNSTLQTQVQSERELSESLEQKRAALVSQLDARSQELDQANTALALMQKQLQDSNIALKLVQEALDDKTVQLNNQADVVEQVTAEMTAKLADLKTDYDSLKADYDELVKPARSSIGKQVAIVYLPRDDQSELFGFRPPGGSYQEMELAELEQNLQRLKNQLDLDLYVRITTPGNSSITQRRSWALTNRLLEAYDYYSQPGGPATSGGQR